VKITETQVRYVADLANLKLTDTEIARMAKDMDEILTHMDALSELDTSGVEPMAQVLYQSDETATLRADEVIPPIGTEAAVANAPLSGGGYYKVPKVIER
jgi:aspartyl-tRNA(Asn)/glutamyl-tRNA(Gln) amidotransferase subunit C